jgi:hypothetical protein
MKVILYFAPLTNRGINQTFYVTVNDVSEAAVKAAAEEFNANPSEFCYSDVEGYVDSVKWQQLRVERLGCLQASMMSARLKYPVIFTGYMLPERHVETSDGLTPYVCCYPKPSWKQLVSDDYLKATVEPAEEEAVSNTLEYPEYEILAIH